MDSEPALVAFENAVLPHVSMLYARAVYLERDPGRASDLLQDTLERALRRFDQFVPGTSAKLWLSRIMFHLFVDRRRREGREIPVDHGTVDSFTAPEPDPPPPWATISEEEIQRAMAHLDQPFRQVLELHVHRQYSYRQISEELSIPEATVGTRLLRARHKIRALLGPELSPLTEKLHGWGARS